MGTVITIDGRSIVDSPSFHAVFAEVFGFPAFYGRNMDAWIDCMSDLDDDTGMTTVQVKPGEVVTIQIDHYRVFKETCPGIVDDLLNCAAFVNWRRIEQGGTAVLVLAYDG